jgi:hypothetical protein
VCVCVCYVGMFWSNIYVIMFLSHFCTGYPEGCILLKTWNVKINHLYSMECSSRLFSTCSERWGGDVILKGSARMFFIFVLLLSGWGRTDVTVAVAECTDLCNSGKAHGRMFYTRRSRFFFWVGGGAEWELHISPLYGIPFYSVVSFTLSSSYAI